MYYQQISPAYEAQSWNHENVASRDEPYWTSLQVRTAEN